MASIELAPRFESRELAHARALRRARIEYALAVLGYTALVVLAASAAFASLSSGAIVDLGAGFALSFVLSQWAGAKLPGVIELGRKVDRLALASV